jgi:HAD superfamily hydrolase (TIGR01484 family)
MVKQKVHAILTDYDGTLVPTADAKNLQTNAVTSELEDILEKICSEIPVCVISTKDYEFLKNKTAFARVLSCMMGIETLVLRNHRSPRTIEKRLLYASLQVLQLKSRSLEAIAEEVNSCEEFSCMVIERKHTSEGILAGLTIDWRHLSDDWSYYRRGITHFIYRMVADLKKSPVPIDIYVQKYSEHPFVDIYSIDCNKGIAFDTVISELPDASAHGRGILYLGDSENDNPAFRKAGISIGIRSDARVNPKLDCSYFLDYEQLSSFLVKLRNNDYLFNDDELLMEAKEHEQTQNGMGQQ